MDIQKLVAWNIRRIRVAKGLSQEALAVDAHIDRTYVSKLERILENPTIGVLDRVAQALQVEVTELFRKPRAGDKAPRQLPPGRKPAR
jgi:transcriptional regulator with XRE-family HTH domain